MKENVVQGTLADAACVKFSMSMFHTFQYESIHQYKTFVLLAAVLSRISPWTLALRTLKAAQAHPYHPTVLPRSRPRPRPCR